jgi:hypothetical protein
MSADESRGLGSPPDDTQRGLGQGSRGIAQKLPMVRRKADDRSPPVPQFRADFESLDRKALPYDRVVIDDPEIPIEIAGRRSKVTTLSAPPLVQAEPSFDPLPWPQTDRFDDTERGIANKQLEVFETSPLPPPQKLGGQGIVHSSIGQRVRNPSRTRPSRQDKKKDQPKDKKKDEQNDKNDKKEDTKTEPIPIKFTAKNIFFETYTLKNWERDDPIRFVGSEYSVEIRHIAQTLQENPSLHVTIRASVGVDYDFFRGIPNFINDTMDRRGAAVGKLLQAFGVDPKRIHIERGDIGMGAKGRKVEFKLGPAP